MHSFQQKLTQVAKTPPCLVYSLIRAKPEPLRGENPGQKLTSLERFAQIGNLF